MLFRSLALVALIVVAGTIGLAQFHVTTTHGAAQEGPKISYFAGHETFNIAVGDPTDEQIQRVRTALNAGRANFQPLVLEGHEPGGQLSMTTLVENFPGFPEGIDGPQLIMNMKQQAIEEVARSGEEAHRRLEEMVSESNPNPIEVGTALLATRTIHEKMKAAEEKFRTDFRSMPSFTISYSGLSSLNRLTTSITRFAT